MKRKYNYFYRTSNKIDNKFYYGIHKTDDLKDGYLGSGKRLNRAIIKHGAENFEKEILKFFDTYEEALNFEAEIVTEELVLNENCYNLVRGGGSGTNPWASDNLHNHNMGKTVYVNGNKEKFYLSPKEAEELELKFILQDRKCFKDNKDKMYFLYENDKRIKKMKLKKHGAFANKIHTEETIKKQKRTFKNTGHQQGIKNSQFGTCWITNGKENKKIHRGDKLPGGWELGRKIKIRK